MSRNLLNDLRNELTNDPPAGRMRNVGGKGFSHDKEQEIKKTKEFQKKRLTKRAFVLESK